MPFIQYTYIWSIHVIFENEDIRKFYLLYKYLFTFNKDILVIINCSLLPAQLSNSVSQSIDLVRGPR